MSVKKMLFISMAALTLGACASDGGAANTDPASSDTAVSESQESAVSSAASSEKESSSDTVSSEEAADNDNEATSEDLADIDDADLEGAEQVSEYADYEELAAQDIFDPADYEGHLVSDNPGNRIFLFSKDGQQSYKTIYIKHDNRLKVIDLQADRMVFNERI